MQKPTRRERQRLRRLRKPLFTVQIDQGEVVRQLEDHGAAADRHR